MNRTIITATAVMLGLAFSLGVLAQETRRVRSTARPIVEYLRPNDEHVTLEWHNPPPFTLLPERDSHVETLTDLSDTVLMLVVEGKEARMTERQDWIRSVVTARVERVLKHSSRLPVDEGGRVTFYEQGGTLRFGGTVVDAVVPWARRFQIGQRYLVFAMVPQEEHRQVIPGDWQITVGPSASYDVASARRLQFDDSGALDAIEVMGPEAAAVLVRERARSTESHGR